MFRLLFMTFYGESRVDHHTEHHIHESPKAMTIPLMVLAVGSVVAGYLGLPEWLGAQHFRALAGTCFEPYRLQLPRGRGTHHSATGVEVGMAAVSVAIAVIGFLVAFSTYYKKSDRADRVSTQFKGLVYRLSEQVVRG